MKPQKQKKIIGMLERFDLPNQLAAVAGIASVGIMIISSGLSQQQSDFSSEETPYPYKFDGTAQGSSEVTVAPDQASTTPASTTVTKESKTPSEASALSSTALTTTTTTDSATPSSKALISPESTTGLNITTKPTRFIEFPQTLTESKRALTATVRAIPSSQTVIPPSNTTVLSSTTAPSRFLPTTSTTASSRFLPVTSNTNIGHRLSTPPSSITLPSTAFIRPSSMAMVNGVVAPSRLTNVPSSTTSPSSSTTTPLNWFPAKVRPTERTFAANSSSTRKGVYLQQAIDDANATAFGLVVAMHKGEINLHSSTWRRAQDAIILLRQGKTRQEAARQAGIPMSVLVQLLEWGKNRPGASARREAKAFFPAEPLVLTPAN